jgi:hypothetical protein
MRDDTAARFAAVRYRRTFRSLRPLLDAEKEPLRHVGRAKDDEDVEDSISGFGDAVISRLQFDERGELFARELLAAWEGNPAHVRLMRVAVDIFPRPDFCSRILCRLRPSWQVGNVPRPRREVMHYCLAEIFRAGATETGIVRDPDELPGSSSGTDVREYHALLLDEGRHILTAAAKAGSRGRLRFPWYLLQQVILYFATHQESLENADLDQLPGAKDILLRSLEVYAFYTGNVRKFTVEDRARHLILQAQAFGKWEEMATRAAAHLHHSGLLRALGRISPLFAEAVWMKTSLRMRIALTKVAREIGIHSQIDEESSGLRCIADFAGVKHLVWHEEYNLVVLAYDLIQARMSDRGGVLTPWRVFCNLVPVGNSPVGHKIASGSVTIRGGNGGEVLFALPKWCVTSDEQLRVEVGQVLRYLLTGSLEYFRPVSSNVPVKELPQYRRPRASWESGRYGSFNGRAAFGPDWIPLSTWAENFLIGLLRWPGCGLVSEGDLTAKQILGKLSHRKSELESCRGEATGMLFLEQEAKWPYRALRKKDRPLRIAVVQSVVPDVKDFTDAGLEDLQLNGSTIRRKHRNHLRRIIGGLHKMLEVRLSHLRGGLVNQAPHLDFVVFPELAVHPADIDVLLSPVVRRHKCIVLAGLVYHPLDSASIGRGLINSAIWLIPEWSPVRGFHIRRVEQGKQNLAPEVEESLRPAVVGHRPVQWIVKYHWSMEGNVRPLYLSASVCYDATDVALAHDLRERSDLIAVCALNRDVPTYDRLAETLNYLLYQGVVVANNGSHGGSSFFAPFEESYFRQVIHFHGQQQAAIAFAEVNPQKFIRRPDDSLKDESPVGKWKKRPAGWRAIPE